MGRGKSKKQGFSGTDTASALPGPAFHWKPGLDPAPLPTTLRAVYPFKKRKAGAMPGQLSDRSGLKIENRGVFQR
jgi:hypothetical protein